MNKKATILVVSNGYGEDQIACNLIKALKKLDPDINCVGLPLVGSGLEYKQLNITPALENPIFPSNGFIRNLSALVTDINAGLLKHLWSQHKTVLKLAKTADATICVGDFFCLALGHFRNNTPVFFLPTAKSDYFMKHSKLETLLVKKWAKKCFPRDKITTASLKSTGIAAEFHGNPMLDNLDWETNMFELSYDTPTLGLVPGSREEAYANWAHFLMIIQEITTQNPKITYLLAKAKTLSLEKLTNAALEFGWKTKTTTPVVCLTHVETNAHMIITESFGDVIGHSTAILGLAGTANEQATYHNIPVFCFEGFGPQSTKQRFYEQKKLLQENLTFIEDRAPKNLGHALLTFFRKTSSLRPAKKQTSTIPASEQIITAIITAQAL